MANFSPGRAAHHTPEPLYKTAQVDPQVVGSWPLAVQAFHGVQEASRLRDRLTQFFQRQFRDSGVVIEGVVQTFASTFPSQKGDPSIHQLLGHLWKGHDFYFALSS